MTRASAEVEIDLTPAGVDNPVPGLSKPAGKPGKATFVVKPTPEGALAQQYRRSTLGVPMLRGSAQMDPAGAVQSATITEARIAPGDDFKVDVVNGPTSLKASVRGASLDARAFVKSLWEGTSSGQAAAKDFDLDAKIASVIGRQQTGDDGRGAHRLPARRRDPAREPARTDRRRRGDRRREAAGKRGS